MKKAKQALAMLLTAVMILGILPASIIADAAFACTAAVEEVYKDDVAGYAYGERPYEGIFNDAFAYKTITDENGEVGIEIVQYYGDEDEVTVPTTINGLPVTSIGWWAFAESDEEYHAGITSVNMPSVLRIDEEAFYCCYYLTTIDMPLVTSIGSYAFNYCEELSTIEMPAVVSVGVGAFESCDYMTTVDMPVATSIGECAFKLCESLTAIDMPAATIIGKHAFAGCESLTSIEIPSAVSIGEGAFSYCSELTSIDMPVVISIGDSAFNYCLSLVSIKIPACTTDIVANPFVHCESLTSIYVVSSNMNYSSTGRILYDKNHTTIISYPTASGDIVLADMITGIGECAFYDCDEMTSIDMPSVTVIGDYAFCYCVELNDIIIGDSLIVVGEGAFSDTGYYYNDDNWEDDVLYLSYVLLEVEYGSSIVTGAYEIKDDVKVIAEYAFNGCIELTSIDMPSVISIGDNAFYSTYRLTTVNIPACTANIGNNPFRFCDLLTDINVAADNMNYSSVGGILYNKDKTLLICYPSASGDVVLPSTVTSIGNSAFYWCYDLASIKMPYVTIIGDEAFYGCGALTTIDMPAVASIGYGAFIFCEGLTSIEIHTAKSIGDYAFYACHGLTTIDLYAVTSIGDYAFSYCSELASVFFYSDAPSYFGVDVFEYCADEFKIYYYVDTYGWTTPTWNGYPAQEFSTTSLILGDVNDDGVVNTGDAVTILRQSVGLISFTDEQNAAADYNGDGLVNTGDAVSILRFCVGL